jgi:hypothetical protein
MENGRNEVLAKVLSAAVIGIDAYGVEVEEDLSRGLSIAADLRRKKGVAPIVPKESAAVAGDLPVLAADR